jgi:hypothetical protein
VGQGLEADLRGYRLRARLARGERAALTLDADLERRWSLQIHFEEQAWSILGDPALGAALASGKLRAATGPGDELHVAEGAVTLLVVDPAGAGAAALALAEIADRLRPAGTTVEALLRATARQDPDPRARAEAVPHLLERAPDEARALARDRAPEVRLAVARAVGGAQGFELAAEILTSEIFHAEIQQAALRFLLSRHAPERVGPVLVDALSAAESDLQGALVTALVGLGPAGAVEALHAALPTAELGNAARIAEALAQLEGTSAEPTLIALLERIGPDGPELPDERDLTIAVADALGRVGHAPALAPLARLARVVPAEGPAGISIKVALELVRARAGARPLHGALALAPGADAEAGRLSPTGS